MNKLVIALLLISCTASAQVVRDFKIGAYFTRPGVQRIPEGYNQKGPIYFWVHGKGEMSSDKSATLRNLLANGSPLNYDLPFPGYAIMGGASDGVSLINGWLDYMLKNDTSIARVWDGKTIIFFGISQGANNILAIAAAQNNPNYKYVVMSPTNTIPAGFKSPTWLFTGSSDNMSPPSTITSIASVLTKAGAEVKTTFNAYAGHGPWNDVLNPNKNKALYDWALPGKATPPPVVVTPPPVVTPAPVKKFSIIVTDDSGAELYHLDVYSDGTSVKVK